MKIHHTLLSIALALGALTACDDIDQADRFEGPVSVNARKNVLVEDFTGQRCVNCPKAADVVTSLQQTYGADRVIAVAIHGGSLSVPDTNPQGLATQQGNDYNSHWGIEAWPKGIIDRSGKPLDFEQWQEKVIERFRVEAKVSIDLPELTYEPETRRLSLHVRIGNNSDAAVNGRLQLWLTESGIVKLQAVPEGGTNRNYVHNHVFRASVNDPYGDEMALQADGEAEKTYSYVLPEAWQADKVALVAFFYNEADGVMQVIDCNISGE